MLKTYDQQFTLTTKKSLHIIFNTIAATNPGIAKPSKKPWISHTSLHLTEEKHSARLLGHTSKLKRQMKVTRANIRQDKQKWADDLATEQKQIL